MMITNKSFFLGTSRFFLVLFLLSVVISVNAETIIVATEEWEWCTEADGTGLYLDILREVFEKEGYTLEINYVPYARSTWLVQNKKADVFIGAYANEVDNVIYPNWHFDNDGVSVVYLKGKNNWTGEENLKNKEVGYIRGYSYDSYFDVVFTPQLVNNRKNGYSMLQKGRIDFFIDAKLEIDSFKRNNQEFWKEANFEVKHAKWLPLYFCFIDSSKGKKLSGIFDQKFKKLLDSGKIKEMFEELEFDSYNFD